MTEREEYLQKTILNNVYEELKSQNKTIDELCKFLLQHTPIKKTRLDKLLKCENKRVLTIKELSYLCYGLNIEPPALLKNIK